MQIIDKIRAIVYNNKEYNPLLCHTPKGEPFLAGFDEYSADSVTRQFIINENTPFIISETYGKIRTNLISAMKEQGYNGAVITSQCRGEGKTTTAINLGISISRLEKRVLLIDADLRRPGAHTLLRLKNRLGLSSILLGECDVYSGINPEVRNNFHVMTAGRLPQNPAELLGGADMERLVRLLYEFYDYIIIDTPPLCIAGDSLLFRGYTAGAALVVRENKTTHSELSDALTAINVSRTNLLGVIKTHCILKYDKSSDYRSSVPEDEEDSGKDEDRLEE